MREDFVELLQNTLTIYTLMIQPRNSAGFHYIDAKIFSASQSNPSSNPLPSVAVAGCTCQG